MIDIEYGQFLPENGRNNGLPSAGHPNVPNSEVSSHNQHQYFQDELIKMHVTQQMASVKTNMPHQQS